MAFLAEGLGKEAGPEDQIGIDPGQVVEVRLDLAGDGVNGLVGIGERIDEGLQAAPEEFIEGVLDGITLRAGEDGVLQDMRQPRGIVGGRPEGDGEEILPVGAVEVEDLRPVAPCSSS